MHHHMHDDFIERPCVGLTHGQISDTHVVMQLKQEVGELSQAGRHDKRQVQKLQLELLQAKQLLDKLHGNEQVLHKLTLS